MKYYDISVPIMNGTVAWPKHSTVEVSPLSEISKGDSSNVSRLVIDAHTATHVDAPHHFLNNGVGIDQVPLDSMIGPAYVADVGDANSVSDEVLDAAGIPSDVERLLIKTSNSELWANPTAEFKTDYVGLVISGAQWVVDRGMKLVGIDYLSIARRDETGPVHNIVLGAGVTALEALDLREVTVGMYRLICLPLRITGCDGAPARVVLVEE